MTLLDALAACHSTDAAALFLMHLPTMPQQMPVIERPTISEFIRQLDEEIWFSVDKCHT